MADGDVVTRESVIEREMDDRRTHRLTRGSKKQVKCDKTVFNGSDGRILKEIWKKEGKRGHGRKDDESRAGNRTARL